jgi:acyl phosphate:glycerol-3-phosphate acyltransferase
MMAIFVWLGAYLIGAIPFGYLVARWRGVDIFQAGSGNIGASNVGRVLGKKFGILVFLFDFAKGALPVAAALTLKKEYNRDEFVERGWLEVGAGLAAFLGHLFPVCLGFRGGKGVATGAGVALALLPGPTLGALLTWLVVVAATSYVSLASLAAAVVLCGLHLLGGLDFANPRTLFCMLGGTLVFVKHQSNIVRLLQGTEPKIGWGEPMRKVLHVLALGLWFGSAIFFNFVVTPSLFTGFEDLGGKQERPGWFPLAPSFEHSDAHIQGPKEQGSRAFGYAVGPLFPWFFLLQGVCGFIAVWTALVWARESPGLKTQRWRARLLIAALLTVLAGWPIEQKVAALRDPRNLATDAYLRADPPSSGSNLEKMQAVRSEFASWHLLSLGLNFVTVLLVTGGMALAAFLPQDKQTAG